MSLQDIYELESKGYFPRRQLINGKVRWVVSDIRCWYELRHIATKVFEDSTSYEIDRYTGFLWWKGIIRPIDK